MMKEFLAALTFLTRIPLPVHMNLEKEVFARAQRFYPLVGLVIGGILYGLAFLGLKLFPPLLMATIVLAGEIALTGGLHLDGFMDSADGLLSGRPADRMLEIMKDSRIGAHAAINLFVLLLFKFALLVCLFSVERGEYLLLLYPALSRWAVLLAMLGFPYARAEGFGKGFHETSHWVYFVFSGIVLLLLSFVLLKWAGIAAWLGALAAAFWLARKVSRQLGGLTGDVYGAIIEISQIVALFCAFSILWLA